MGINHQYGDTFNVNIYIYTNVVGEVSFLKRSAGWLLTHAKNAKKNFDISAINPT